jgi:thioredoxin 1
MRAAAADHTPEERAEEMMAEHNVTEIGDAQFEGQVEQGTGLALVDFWAPWCGPCRMVAPVIEELSRAYDGQVRFFKLNVDEAPRTAAAYGIRSIPTIALFKDGEAVGGVVGAAPRSQLEGLIREHMVAAA